MKLCAMREGTVLPVPRDHAKTCMSQDDLTKHTPFMRQNVRMLNKLKHSKAFKTSCTTRNPLGHLLDTVS